MLRLLEFFEGQSGSLSSTRLLAFLASVTILGTWCWVSLAKLELQPMAPELVFIVLGATGLIQLPKLTGGKKENGTPP